jgi:ADP-ribose pyrophosphatase
MKLISSVEKYKNNLFSVTEDRAIDPDGFEIKRGIVQHRGSAVMMAVDERRRILLVRQYRLPARQRLWELPAGSVDPGENPLQTAKRELKEETGCRAKTWKKLTAFYPSPGFVAEKMTIYLATDLTQGEATPMDDERIETRWFQALEVERMILTGKIVDAKTMIGYFLWRRTHGSKRSTGAVKS